MLIYKSDYYIYYIHPLMLIIFCAINLLFLALPTVGELAGRSSPVAVCRTSAMRLDARIWIWLIKNTRSN